MLLYGFVIFVHVVVCITLIAIILLQAGRGGGLSETFGGESSRTIFGTKASVFLAKATVVAASLFLVTCLVLGIMTSRRGRSLIDLQRRKALPLTMPIPESEEKTLEGTADESTEGEVEPFGESEQLPTE